MSIYETILLEDEYLKVAKEIGSLHFISDGKWDWCHGLGHYIRVADYTKRILYQLNSNERTIDLGMTASLLHDLGLVRGSKKGHAEESAKMCSDFLENKGLSTQEFEQIRHAILDHSKGLEMNSPLDIALTLADKLDVTYHRTIHSTIQDYLNKEIQKIKKVDIEISKDTLTVNYSTEKDFNASVLKEWDKTYLIPLKVALILQKKYHFLINEKTTILESEIRKCLKNGKI